MGFLSIEIIWLIGWSSQIHYVTQAEVDDIMISNIFWHKLLMYIDASGMCLCVWCIYIVKQKVI